MTEYLKERRKKCKTVEHAKIIRTNVNGVAAFRGGRLADASIID